MFWRLFHSTKIGRYAHGGNSWALVTGASDGIGRGIAIELLDHGLNVILHGRNQDKLSKLAAELLVRFPARQVDTLVLDGAVFRGEGAPQIHAAVAPVLEGKTLTALVNNLGWTHKHASVWEQTPEEIDEVIMVDMRFMTQMTRATLPHLMKNEPALIINVSGLARSYPSPTMAVHSGSKAFIMGFSRALALELKLAKKDVECIGVDVHHVSTNSNPAPTDLMTPTAEVEGKAIVGVVGCGKLVVTAYWPHELVTWILTVVPNWVMDGVVTNAMVLKLKESADADKAK